MDRFPYSLISAIGGACLGGALADLLAVPKEYRGLCVLLVLCIVDRLLVNACLKNIVGYAFCWGLRSLGCWVIFGYTEAKWGR